MVPQQLASYRGRDRRRAEYERARAANDRAEAAADRATAAEERARARRDCALARYDRVLAARHRQASQIDELTGVARRGPGIEQLRQEIDRARRRGEGLVVAFVDVDGLKHVNDTRGHLAGDALLVAVADCLRASLRSYDLIMRFGGDEFVCALAGVCADGARGCFARVGSALSVCPTGGSVTVGVAELGDADVAEDLIRRADAALLATRDRSRASSR
jgi:diguanylate cyclase (GGDEF)-like protein